MRLTSDNIVIRLLGEVGKLVVVNVLVILCSLPVVTALPALAAGYACLARREDPSETVTAVQFFRAFRGALRAGTGVGLSLLAGCLLALGDLFYALWVAETVNWFFLAFAAAALTVLLGMSVWSVPLVAGYENTVSGHLKNAFLLAFGRLPVTLAVWEIAAALLLPLCSEFCVLCFGWLYPLCGVALLLWLSGLVLERSLRAL